LAGILIIRIEELGSEIGERKSKDKMIESGGRNFIDWIQKERCYMMNGTIGD